MTGSPPGPAYPAGTPALTSAPPNPELTREEPPTELSPPPISLPTTAPASRPSGRYAVGLRPSLDPDAYLDVRAATEDSPNLRSPRS